MRGPLRLANQDEKTFDDDTGTAIKIRAEASISVAGGTTGEDLLALTQAYATIADKGAPRIRFVS